jgi:adenine-specific DNA-methyltransferase
VVTLSHAGLKKHFFQDVDSLLVFDKVKFQKFISNKQFLPDSYTQFKNKIGLTANGTYLTESKEVVLDFPYKDCVLQGCQDKEDSKRNEVFFNETLAPDDIDMLLEPKVLTNFKKYDATGEHKVTDLNTQDNLIIKGNNLLALHSLLSVYRGKVKLIYIDPPYNTGNDGFGYNDKFNHSTWLTFMKNRLEVARELLREDGVIFVQCDDNEQAYLKVLLDEVFKRDNFINLVSLMAKSTSGASGGGEDKKLKKNLEYVVIYSKTYDSFAGFKPQFKDTELMQYIADMKNNGTSFKYTSILYSMADIKPYKTILDGSGKDIELFKVGSYEIKSVKEVARLEGISEKEVYIKYYDKVMTTTNAQTSIRQRVWDETINDENLFIARYTPQSGKNKNKIIDLMFIGKQKVLIIWLKDTSFKNNNIINKREKIGTYWDKLSWINVNREGEVDFSNGKKPEELLKRIIDMSTSEGDIVLDYHLGSGTTAAVTHKMGRQYIGIEQMDYIEDLAVTRLKNVIGKADETKDLLKSETIYKDFDSSGISKAINWQGGGSFVYCELKQNSQLWVDNVINAIDSNELLNIWQIMQDKAQLSYKIDVKTINNSANDFNQLSLGEQKQILLEVIDKNQLYVNYTEIDDVDYQCSEEEKNLNNIFYGLK